MKYFIGLVCITTFFACTHGSSPVEKQRAFLQTLLSSRANEVDPELTMKCVYHYSAELDDATVTYGTMYDSCQQQANIRKEAIEVNSQVNHNKLHDTVYDYCNNYLDCDLQTTAGKIFECYASHGDSTSHGIKQVSIDAKEYKESYDTGMNEVKTQLNLCLTEAERLYNNWTSSIFVNLQECMDGKDNLTPRPPTPPPTTYFPITTTAPFEPTTTTSMF